MNSIMKSQSARQERMDLRHRDMRGCSWRPFQLVRTWRLGRGNIMERHETPGWNTRTHAPGTRWCLDAESGVARQTTSLAMPAPLWPHCLREPQGTNPWVLSYADVPLWKRFSHWCWCVALTSALPQRWGRQPHMLGIRAGSWRLPDVSTASPAFTTACDTIRWKRSSNRESQNPVFHPENACALSKVWRQIPWLYIAVLAAGGAGDLENELVRAQREVELHGSCLMASMASWPFVQRHRKDWTKPPRKKRPSGGCLKRR